MPISPVFLTHICTRTHTHTHTHTYTYTHTHTHTHTHTSQWTWLSIKDDITPIATAAGSCGPNKRSASTHTQTHTHTNTHTLWAHTSYYPETSANVFPPKMG